MKVAVFSQNAYCLFAARPDLPYYFWRSIFSPANVLLHALFHLARVTLGILSGELDWDLRQLRGGEVSGDAK